MKMTVLILPAVVLLSACQTSNQNAAALGATGALIGAAVADDDDRLAGAALGAAAGVAASTLIGPASTPGNCFYRNSMGQRVVAPC